ncbi:inheritance of peroxisomes protein 1-domain-containing protein [Mariannaea sp. PMI_226]|nr:inheritance of peroxisomes protein 1-domain-containing protein [Mariannaea sp. PMI_226]
MDDSTPTDPRFRTPRRVATAPVSTAESVRASSTSPPPSEGLVEILYSHPNIKIISFTSASRINRTTGLPSDDVPGTLSWSSQLERTIAVGLFRIYRAPGSVAFLNCGSALQPILPRSQCWCIDEINSKFVLQIRRPNYWRIELPVDEPEDQERAEALRAVLDKILQFEKTECPFKRSFTVELPEPQTPVKKRPWTPVPRSLAGSPDIDLSSPISTFSFSRRTSFLQRASTSNILSSGDEAYEADEAYDADEAYEVDETDEADLADLSDDAANRHRENLRRYMYPHVRTEAAKLEARIEADALLNPEPFPHHGHEAGSESESVSEGQWVSGNDSQSPLIDRNERQRLILELQQFETSSLASTVNVPEMIARIGALAPELQGSSSSSVNHRALQTAEASILEDTSSGSNPAMYELHEGSGSKKGQIKTRLRQRSRFAVSRSATLPPHLKASVDRASDFSPSMTPVEESKTPLPGSPRPTGDEPFSDLPQHRRRGSDDSFGSVQSWHSQSAPPPSTPLSRPDIHATELGEQSSSKGLVVNDADTYRTLTEMSDSWEPGSENDSEASQTNITPLPGDDLSPKATEDFSTKTEIDANLARAPTTVMRRRQTLTSHRPTTGSISVGRTALSPLPSAADLFAPAQTMDRRPLKSKLEKVKNLPMTIIYKTLEMLLGPPSYLIALMLKVAAKIVAGEWRGLVFGYDDDGAEIPVQWDYSEGDFSDWSDDEPYTSSLNRRHSQRHRRNRHQGSQHHHHRVTTDKNKAVEGSEASSDDGRSSRSSGVD